MRDLMDEGQLPVQSLYEPSVTLLVPAFNEKNWLKQKLDNALNLDYPREKIKIMVISDGSNDTSSQIIENYPRVIHLHEPERRGKMAAINRAMRFVDTEIVIFSDANTLLNHESVRELTRFFQAPQVGCVCGEKRLTIEHTNDAASAGEGVYWRYESRIRAAEARIGSCIGATGELFAIRTTLFREAPDDTLIDDFIISMDVALRGYRIQYAPLAYAVEASSAGINEEFKRKVRISAGNIQAISRMPQLLNPFRHGVLAFQYLSHKFLRSIAAPLCFAALIPMNILLLNSGMPYVLMSIAQLLFYITAGTGYLLRRHRLSSKLFFIPLYVVIMNLAALVGMCRHFTGRQSVLWEKAIRKDEFPGKDNP